ncbi:MAG: hypothetical protein DRI90_01960 [Deltaproteobacteria bacterium]|nr:MAG: hypothetical protein DRI90_01960 [Deltaproteobacteria bacterium]
MLVEAVGHLLIFDSTGKLVNDLAVGVGVTAVTLHEGWLLLGYGDGNIDLRPVGPQAVRPGFTFEQTAASPVETIIPGPSGTLIAGYGNGLLGIWDRESGVRLAQATLHGPITHLRLVGRELHVATDLGHFMTWDLSTFYVEHCELLRQVWQQIPVVWSAGHPVLRPPPADHHCQPR